MTTSKMKTVYWEDRNLDGQALADEFLRLLNLPVTTARFPITAVGTPSNISSVGPALGRLSAPLSAKRPFPKRRPHLPRQRRCQDSLPRRIQISEAGSPLRPIKSNESILSEKTYVESEHKPVKRYDFTDGDLSLISTDGKIFRCHSAAPKSGQLGLRCDAISPKAGRGEARRNTFDRSRFGKREPQPGLPGPRGPLALRTLLLPSDSAVLALFGKYNCSAQMHTARLTYLAGVSKGQVDPATAFNGRRRTMRAFPQRAGNWRVGIQNKTEVELRPQTKGWFGKGSKKAVAPTLKPGGVTAGKGQRDDQSRGSSARRERFRTGGVFSADS